MSTIAGIAACVFDAYGTLFDVHSAVGRHRAHLGNRADAVSALWRAKQLEYTWLRSLMRRHADFWQVTGDALDYAFETHGIHDNDLRQDLMAAYLRLDAYPDVAATLHRLKAAGVQTAILSNGSPPMLHAAVTSAGIADLIDAVWSVEEVGVYKPDPRVYALAVERLGVEPGAVCFQSANPWDAAGAACCGLRVVWINRTGGRLDKLPCRPDAEIGSLAELPALLGINEKD